MQPAGHLVQPGKPIGRNAGPTRGSVGGEGSEAFRPWPGADRNRAEIRRIDGSVHQRPRRLSSGTDSEVASFVPESDSVAAGTVTRRSSTITCGSPAAVSR